MTVLGGGIADMMFTLVPIFIGAIFILVIGFIAYGIFTGVKQWNYNNKQPVLSVFAKVVTKRTDVSTNMSNHGTDGTLAHQHSTTSYFATFEVESGDRMEFTINGKQYGLLAEGDLGKLTFQGSRYLGFERRPE